MSRRADRANRVNDCVVLMRKNRAQIELEGFVCDVPDDWRSQGTQSTREFVYGTILRHDIDGDRRDCRSWQSPTADFDDAATDADLCGQTTQALENGGGTRAQFVLGNSQESECGDFRLQIAQMKIDRRLERGE